MLQSKRISWGLLCLALGVLGVVLKQAITNHPLPLNDFSAFWGAAWLLAKGSNPYDTKALLVLQQSLGWHKDFPLLVWNPPWVALWLFPLAGLPFPIAQWIWIAILVALITTMAAIWWHIVRHSWHRVIIAFVLAMTFPPTLMLLKQQQLSAFVLLSATLFTVFHRRRPILAGASLLFLSTKPHLAMPFALVLILWVWQQRAWHLITGSIVSLIFFSLSPLLLFPNIWQAYFISALGDLPTYWVTPTLTTLVRLIGGPERTLLIWVLPAISLGIALWLWKRNQRRWRWFEQTPLLLSLGLLLAPYAWLFDQILLLPLLIELYAYIDTLPVEKQRWLISLYVLWCVLYIIVIQFWQSNVLITTMLAPLFVCGYLVIRIRWQHQRGFS